jgi:hypothetical protein
MGGTATASTSTSATAKNVSSYANASVYTNGSYSNSTGGIDGFHGAAVQCSASSHHHWWKDNSEQHFVYGITLCVMIVVMVCFEMLHHKVHRWCAQQDSAHVDVHSEEYMLEKKEKQIRKYLTSGIGASKVQSHHGSHLLPLLHRMSDEMMFLGFLAFFLWVLKVSGFFDAIFVGIRWGAMAHVWHCMHACAFVF